MREVNPASLPSRAGSTSAGASGARALGSVSAGMPPGFLYSPPLMDEATAKTRLKQWIRDHAKAPIGAELADDTPILERGILSSLDIVELVLFIESLRGDEVDPDAIEPETFRDVGAMMKGFFAF